MTSSTIAIQAQRLVRRLCDRCKEAYVAETASITDVGLRPEMVEGKQLYQAKGCESCMNRGYYGRTGIFELLVMTPHIQELALRGADSNHIKREARKQGMRTLREDGAQKILRGATTIEEILRVTRDDLVEEVLD
ncbi:MAG: hypothetical protein HYZ00_10840 [Candidatus Hydrogenedentes bacterium]|nr:hypothetical protein [Candidatus Hydrogenedentota bacterium]